MCRLHTFVYMLCATGADNKAAELLEFFGKFKVTLDITADNQDEELL